MGHLDVRTGPSVLRAISEAGPLGGQDALGPILHVALFPEHSLRGARP